MAMFPRAFAPFAAALVVLAGFCATASAETVLRRGNLGAPESLDPHRITGSWENHVVGDLFEGLIAENARAEPIPGQATHWEISGDGRVYTFYLRKDARWSDGSPVTADDFEYAIKRILDPKKNFPYASLLSPISGAREYNAGRNRNADLVGVIALDEHTLLIILSHPTPHFLTQLKHWSAYPVPRAVVEKHGDDWVKPENIVSNGPYRLQSQSGPDTITLVRNEHHHAAAEVRIDTVVYTAIEDAAEGVVRFKAGAIDLYPNFPGEQFEALKASLPAETRVHPALGTYYYALNTLRPPFDSRDIRRAFALAVDRERIVGELRRTGELPAYSFVPVGTLNYRIAALDFENTARNRRLAEARALIARAGYGAGKPLAFTLIHSAGEVHRRIAEAIAAVWLNELGVEVTLLGSDSVRDHYARLQRREFHAASAGWNGDYNDAQNFLFLGEASSGKLNYAGYSNPDFDLLMDEASAAEDRATRAEILHRAEEILLTDLPYVPIHYYVSQNLVSQAVKGFEDNIEDLHRTRWLAVER